MLIMELKWKIKLKKEYIDDLYQTYPNAFTLEHKWDIKKNNWNNNFIKLVQMKIEIRNKIIEQVWITYLWYLNILLDTLDYSNRIEFWVLKQLWISESMIKVVRKKLRDNDIVKKVWFIYYLNPKIAVKWDIIPIIVENLFK